jgi:hypothetical protein
MLDGYKKVTPKVLHDVSLFMSSSNLCSAFSFDLPDVTVKRGTYTEGEVEFGPSYPDWRKKAARHEDATSSLSGSQTWLHYQPGYITGHVNCAAARRNVYDHLQGSHLVVPQVPAVRDIEHLGPDVEADNAAKTAFMADLRDAQTAFQGLTFLGELRETLAMIRRPAKALHDGIFVWKKVTYQQLLKKGHAKHFINLVKEGSKLTNAQKAKVKAIADAVTGSWLEKSFGWNPLVNDIDDGMKALANQLVQENYYPGIAIRARGRNEDTSSVKYDNGGGGIFHFSSDLLTHTKDLVVYRGYYSGNAQDALAASKAQAYWGIRLEELAPTIWELTPWSFLLDYFLNIGDIITAASYWRAGLAWSNRTIVSQSDRAILRIKPDVDSFKTWGAVIDDFIPQTTVIHNKVVRRESYKGTFIPELEFSIPGKPTQWLNMASLAWLRSGIYLPHK